MAEKLFYSEHDLDAKGILSRSTRWRGQRDGTFPKPVRLSKGRVAYPASVIDAWVAECMGGGESHAI